jgi:hypothetical protein
MRPEQPCPGIRALYRFRSDVDTTWCESQLLAVRRGHPPQSPSIVTTIACFPKRRTIALLKRRSCKASRWSSCRSSRQPSPLTASKRDGRAAPHTARLPLWCANAPVIFRKSCPFPFAARFSHEPDAIMGRRRSLSTAGPLHSPPSLRSVGSRVAVSPGSVPG